MQLSFYANLHSQTYGILSYDFWICKGWWF